MYQEIWSTIISLKGFITTHLDKIGIDLAEDYNATLS